MLDFLSNRATAAHLALAAVAPLVLCAYAPAGGSTHAVLYWLLVFSAIWGFMAPVRLDGEHTPDAQLRLLSKAYADPFLWVTALVFVYAVVAALNTGTLVAYDFELKVWKLQSPPIAEFPGGALGSGSSLVIASLLVFVIYAGVAYSLDGYGSVAFMLTASLIAVIAIGYAVAGGKPVSGDWAATFGLWMLGAAAVMLSAESERRHIKELVSALTFAGCLAAMLLAKRPTVVVPFLGAAAMLVLLYIGFCFRDLKLLGVIRALAMLVVATAIALGVYGWLGGDLSALVPAWTTDADSLLDAYALGAWKSSPWTGTGVGSFPLVAKFAATAEDWAVLGPLPDYGRNAWRLLLVERGALGLALVAVSFGALLYNWCRATFRRGLEDFAPAVLLLPLALAALSVAMVFDGSALRPEAMVAWAALAGFSINGGK